MPIKAINLEKRVRVISRYDEAQTEEDGATVWIIGAVDSATFARIRDGAMKMSFGEGSTDAEVAQNTTVDLARARMNYELVRASLRGWENFEDDDGNEVAFVTVKQRGRDVPSESVMQRIPNAVIDELAEKVRSFNTLTEEELGNFDEQPTPRSSSEDTTAELVVPATKSSGGARRR